MKGMLDVDEYQRIIKLGEVFNPPAAAEIDGVDIDTNVMVVLEYILGTPGLRSSRAAKDGVPRTRNERRNLIQALLTTRDPATVPIPEQIHRKIDAILQHERQSRKTVDARQIAPIEDELPGTAYPMGKRCKIWQGDITTLEVDAIVNAANSQMLGCFQPFHKCIDNAIHAAAGPRVRDDCFAIMNKQGYQEETGRAKITRGYNLPARYILHTVGPIHHGGGTLVSDEEVKQLASCYSLCLNLCLRVPSIKSIAFCSISTGVFGFPKDAAARVALRAVADWFKGHPAGLDSVVFNVFSPEDKRVYEDAVSNWSGQ